MGKYTVYQYGGDDATGSQQFNDYVDQILASQQNSYDEPDYEQTNDNEESEYIHNLREFDQNSPNNNDFSTKIDNLTSLIENKLSEIQNQKDEFDWFASDEGTNYLANNYDTQTQTTEGKSRNNYGNIRGADGNFVNYDTPEAGRMALINQLSLYQTGRTKNNVKPESSLYQAMAVYAPASDNNNPKHYAEFVAKRLGVDPNTPIKNINTNQWADAIAAMEGNKNIGK